VKRKWTCLALLVVLAELLFGETIRIPIKKKGAGPLFRIHYGDKWGFMDRTGRVVIRPQFSDVGDFFDGLAKILMPAGKGYKYCFINESGETAIPCVFDNAGDFSEGLAPVKVGRRWGYINTSGTMVIAPQFQGAAEIRDGFGRVEVWDRVSCLDQTYTKDDAPAYAFVIYRSHATTGCFAEHARFGYVSKAGGISIKPEFPVAEDFSEGLAEVKVEETAGSKYAFIDKTGRIAIPAQFDQTHPFSEGLAAVDTGFREENGSIIAGSWGFIDKSGAFVISPRFKAASGFSEGLAPASEGFGLWGYIDRTGRFVIAPAYDEASDFSEGLSAVCPRDESGDCVYINRSGKKVLKVDDALWPFSDGLTIVGQHGRGVYVDRRGRTIAPYEVKPE
jgi:hypothetical protein